MRAIKPEKILQYSIHDLRPKRNLHRKAHCWFQKQKCCVRRHKNKTDFFLSFTEPAPNIGQHTYPPVEKGSTPSEPHIQCCGCLVAWLFGCLFAWLLGCLVAWLPGCLVAGPTYLQPPVEKGSTPFEPHIRPTYLPPRGKRKYPF